MLYRIAQTLQHAFRSKPSVSSSVFGLSTFSLCRTSFLGRRGIADSTPRPSQSPQDLDEAQLDEERRRAKTEYQRAWLRKKREDPVWLEQHRKRDRENVARWRQTQKKDEARWEQVLDRQITDNQKSKWRIKADPVKRQNFLARRRESWRQRADAFRLKRHQTFKMWFSVNKDRLDTFTWKRWRPVVLTESVDKVCATCKIRHRKGPRRLWFIRKSDPELWDCLACFVSSDMSDIVPVKGAERFYKGRYLQPQSTATEGTVDYKDTVDTVDPKQKNDDILQGQDHLRPDKDTGADHKTTGT